MNNFWPENRLEEDGKKLERGAIDVRVKNVEVNEDEEGGRVGGWERQKGTSGEKLKGRRERLC